MVSFNYVEAAIVAMEAQPSHLIILGLIAVVAMGSLLAPLLKPLARAVMRAIRFLGQRLWNIVIEKLITVAALAALALLGSIAWLADLAELLATLLRH